eukprot:COSAG01_NODE_6181_length_3806_cov_2.435932_6_plen_67_part_00
MFGKAYTPNVSLRCQMAVMFDKIGKEAKDLLGKGMDTDKKFTFSTTAFEGLVSGQPFWCTRIIARS